MGYTADHAKDGLEVLELCERAALADSLYDIILLDIQMPNMDVYPSHRRKLIIGIRGNQDLASEIRERHSTDFGCGDGECDKFR